MTASLFMKNSVAVRRFCLSIGLILVFAAAAPGQIQQTSLSATLKGAEATSTIIIGGTGAPVGYSAPYPVNTLVYPDGQIVYRVEWAMMRGEVGQMQKRFMTGTTFQITSVEFKNDCLELKLLGRNRDSGHLKVMFGAGWQAQMTNAVVLQTLGKFLSLPSVQSDAQLVRVAATSSPQLSVQDRTSVVAAVAATALYSRPANAPVIPGRIPNEQLQAILPEADVESQQTVTDLLKQAASAADALLSIQRGARQYPNFARHPRIEDISALQNRLGKSLQPKQVDDVIALNNVLQGCRVFYKFGPPNVYGMSASLNQAIEAQKQRQEQIVRARNSVIEVEKALDSGDLSEAYRSYQQLSTDTPVPHFAQQYLQQTQSLGNDLASYSQAIAMAAPAASTAVAAIHIVSDEEAQLAGAAGKPLTSAYWQRHLDADKEALRRHLDALPAFHFDRKLYTTATVDHLTQLRALLQPATDLTALMGDQTALGLARSWYGDAMYESLTEKGKEIPEAQSLEGKLQTQIETEQKQRQEAEERKQALIEERESLATEIVNKAVLITMLDEKFQLTEVIGYKMEASKQRTELLNLVHTNRALLNSAEWGKVNQQFEQILPGLTVWRASHTQAILAGLK